MPGSEKQQFAAAPSPAKPGKREAGPGKSVLVADKLAMDRRLAVLVFALSLAYLCMFRRSVSIDPDEGIILQGAQRILEGQVLYRDFFSYFTPGSYYFLALLFRIFGSSILVAHTALAVSGATFPVYTYLVARRVCARWPAIAAAYLVTLTAVPWRFLTLHNWDSTLFACAAIYCAVRLLEAPRWEWAFGAGSFASLTALFEQSKGAGLLLGLALGMILVRRFAGTALRVSRGQQVALFLGLVWPFALTIGYFGMHHALPALWADWTWPLHHYTKANSVPYGYQNWSDESRRMMFGTGPWLVRVLALFTVSPGFVIPVLPIVGIVLLVYWTAQRRTGHLTRERASHYMLVCSSMVGLLFSAIAVRADIHHFVFLAPVLYLVLAWIMDGTDIRGWLFSSIRPLVTIGILMTFTAVGMAFLIRNRNARTVVETRRGRVLMDSADEVVPYVQSHLPAGSKMFVYPYLPLYYFLTATYNPSRYEYLQPGMHTRSEDEEAIREIEAARTPVVLLEVAFDDKIPSSWPNTPIESVATDPVTDFLLARYRPCKVLTSAAKWRFVYMVRKDLVCPGLTGASNSR